MIDSPTNITEWVDYITSGIPAMSLIHQARVAGSSSFIRMMTQEGYTAQDLALIHKAFADRFVMEGFRIPSQMDDCHIDYNALVEEPDENLTAPLIK